MSVFFFRKFHFDWKQIETREQSLFALLLPPFLSQFLSLQQTYRVFSNSIKLYDGSGEQQSAEQVPEPRERSDQEIFVVAFDLDPDLDLFFFLFSPLDLLQPFEAMGGDLLPGLQPLLDDVGSLHRRAL